MPGDSKAALSLIQTVSERGGEVGDALGGWWKDIPLSDVWNGKVFAAQWGATTRYNHETKEWIIFNGSRWRADKTGEIDRRAVATADSLPNLMIIGDGKNQSALSAQRYLLLQGKNLEEMKRRAKSEMPCTSDQFDTDPMLLGVTNGTLDLNTGELRPHRAEDMLMKQAPVTFNPDAIPDEWLKAVWLWMAGDPAMIAYVRRVAGLFLTGDVGDEAFFMLLGPSGTGKGTFVSTIEALLGTDYAFPLSVEWFQKTNNQPIPIEAHAARGMRLMTVSENEKNAQFNTAKIKQWTGGDAMTGRGMRENLSTYMPTHKLLLQTNHSPKFDSTIARRLKNIGFLSVVPEADRKYGLKKYLRENELSGILNWALGALPGEERMPSDGDGPLLRGLADWRVNRLNTPEEVTIATTALLEAQDDFKEFADTLIVDASKELSRDEGYLAYRRWCERALVRRPLGRNAFFATMREAGFREKSLTVAGKRPRGWAGITMSDAPATSAAASGFCQRCPRRAIANGRCADHANEAEGDERFSLQ